MVVPAFRLIATDVDLDQRHFDADTIDIVDTVTTVETCSKELSLYAC